MKAQTITKENLKKIHDVACSTWKEKLEGYAKRKPFDNEVELTGDEIEEMFAASDANQKKILNKFFVKEKIGIMGKVGSYEDACKVLNISVEKKTPYERLCIIIKALNEGWYPDFNNSSEYKYWNYFRMVDGAFSFCAVGYFDSHILNVPSALYLKTRELAEYAVEIAFEEYKETYL